MHKTTTQPDGLLPFVLWCSAALIAAIMATTLTWDGAYYYLGSVREGAGMIAHHRFANYILLEPVALLSRQIAWFYPGIVLHGLLCVATGIIALWCVLRWSRHASAVRVWFVAGLVLTPLPGILAATMEVIPALQTFWLVVAAAKFLRPNRAMIVAAMGSLWMMFLHPVAIPLLTFAALAAFAMGERSRKCALVFAGMAVARGLWLLVASTSYERSQLDSEVVKIELDHFLACSPWLLVFLAWCLVLLASRREIPLKVLWICWLGLACYGAWRMSEPSGWSGALNYRKFAFPVVLPFLLPALLAMRGPKTDRPQDRVSLHGVVLVASVAWIAGSLSWASLLGRFQTEILQAPGPIVKADAVPCIRGSSLEHWSATPTAMILLGPGADRLFLGHGVRVEGNFVQLFPGEKDPSPVPWASREKTKADR